MRDTASRRLRIALYSHDTMGLGHMRRNLLLAQALSGKPASASVLLIAGSSEINALYLPPGVDCLSLPALAKSRRGEYLPRRLAVSLEEVTELRSNTIRVAVKSFSPDVLIVDNIPRGACGELNATLAMLSEEPLVRCVLGLRDILDDAESVKREWDHANYAQALAKFYDAVWVYGDRQVFDPVAAYAWSNQIADKTSFTGYLDPCRRLQAMQLHGEDSLAPWCGRRFVACTCGGGQDGFRLARAFLGATLPRDIDGIVLAGPCMPERDVVELRRLAKDKHHKVVWQFVPEADALIKHAWRVVAMGGYNTLCSVVCHRKPALIVPRESPRLEQSMRAERFEQLGLVDTLSPPQATSAALSAWLSVEVPRPPPGRLDFHGLQRIPQMLDDVVAAPRRISRGRNLLPEAAHVGT